MTEKSSNPFDLLPKYNSGLVKYKYCVLIDTFLFKISNYKT